MLFQQLFHILLCINLLFTSHTPTALALYLAWTGVAMNVIYFPPTIRTAVFFVVVDEDASVNQNLQRSRAR